MTNSDSKPQIDRAILLTEASALARELSDAEASAWETILRKHSDAIAANVEISFPGYHPQQVFVLNDGSALTMLPHIVDSTGDEAIIHFVGYFTLQDLYNALSRNIKKDSH